MDQAKSIQHRSKAIKKHEELCDYVTNMVGQALGRDFRLLYPFILAINSAFTGKDLVTENLLKLCAKIEAIFYQCFVTDKLHPCISSKGDQNRLFIHCVYNAFKEFSPNKLSAIFNESLVVQSEQRERVAIALKTKISLGNMDRLPNKDQIADFYHTKINPMLTRTTPTYLWQVEARHIKQNGIPFRHRQSNFWGMFRDTGNKYLKDLSTKALHNLDTSRRNYSPLNEVVMLGSPGTFLKQKQAYFPTAKSLTDIQTIERDLEQRYSGIMKDISEYNWDDASTSGTWRTPPKRSFVVPTSSVPLPETLDLDENASPKSKFSPKPAARKIIRKYRSFRSKIAVKKSIKEIRKRSLLMKSTSLTANLTSFERMKNFLKSLQNLISNYLKCRKALGPKVEGALKRKRPHGSWQPIIQTLEHSQSSILHLYHELRKLQRKLENSAHHGNAYMDYSKIITSSKLVQMMVPFKSELMVVLASNFQALEKWWNRYQNNLCLHPAARAYHMSTQKLPCLSHPPENSEKFFKNLCDLFGVLKSSLENANKTYDGKRAYSYAVIDAREILSML
ncbi:MAG: hypothetical protein ACR2M9_01000 [Cyanophyceae cyanobacterium]